MGVTTTCCSSGLDMSNFDANIGLEDDNVTEKFQYHQVKCRDYDIQGSIYDQFYKEVCYPMYLLTVEQFNQLLDEMVQEGNAC